MTLGPAYPSGGDLDPEDQDVVDSIKNLPDGAVPIALDEQLTDDLANFNYDNVTDTLTVANLIVPGDAIVEGTVTIINTENLSVADSFIDMGAGNTAVAAKEGGLAVNYFPTAANDTVTAGAFVAGVASTSNPTVQTDTASVFTLGEIVQISGTNAGENDGFYETFSHIGNVFTPKGVGLNSTVKGFSRNQFVANASDNATITKINITSISTGIDGTWGTEKGSSTDDMEFQTIVRNNDNSIDLKILADNGTAPINFRDENEVIEATIEYRDTAKDLTFETATGDISLDANSDIELTAANGNINLSAIDGLIRLNEDIKITTDQSIIFTSQSASGVTSILFDSSLDANKLDINFNESTDSTEIVSAVSTQFSATTGNVLINSILGEVIQNAGAAFTELSSDAYQIEDGSGKGVLIDLNNSQMDFSQGTFSGSLDYSVLTGTRTWTLPDSTGTFLLDTDTTIAITPDTDGIGTFRINDDVGVLKVEVSYEDDNDIGFLAFLSDASVTSSASLDIDAQTSLNFATTSDDIVFSTNLNAERLRIEDTTGNVGIGKTPSTKLDVSGDITGHNVFPEADATYALGKPDFRYTDVFLDSTINYIGNLLFEGEDGVHIDFNTTPTRSNIDIISPSASGFGSVNFENNVNEIKSDITYDQLNDTLDITGNSVKINSKDAVTTSDVLTNNVFMRGAGNAAIDAIQSSTGTIRTNNGGNTIEIVAGESGTGNLVLQDDSSNPKVTLEWSQDSATSNLTTTSSFTIDTTGDLILDASQEITLSSNSNADQLVLDTNGRIGIGTDVPASLVHTYEDNASTLTNGMTIEQDGVGDASIRLTLTGVQDWTIGAANALGDGFAISDGLSHAINTRFYIDTTGRIGMGTTSPARPLQVGSATSDPSTGIIRYGHHTGANFREWDVGTGDAALFGHNDNFGFCDVTGSEVVSIIERDTGYWGLGNINPSSRLHVTEVGDDTVSVQTLETTGTSGASTAKGVGDRNPNGVRTGAGGDEHVQASGGTSATYESKETATGTEWLQRNVYQPKDFEINTQAEWDALFTANVRTINAGTTVFPNLQVSGLGRFVMSGVDLTCSARNISEAGMTYTGSGALFSGSGQIQCFDAVDLQGTLLTGSQLIDITAGLLIDNVTLRNWDSMGSSKNGSFAFRHIDLVNITEGFNLTNCANTLIHAVALFGAEFNGTFVTHLNRRRVTTNENFTDLRMAAFGPNGTMFNFGMSSIKSSPVTINNIALPQGDLFKQPTTANGVINSVINSAITTGTLTEMSDNGDFGTTVLCTSTYFDEEELTISGTTNYNGTHFIYNVVAGVSFDIPVAFEGDDATGSSDSARLALTLAASHGITTGTPLKVIESNFYNGFVTALNLPTANELIINGTFRTTDTGEIKIDVGLDQTDPRILAENNFPFPNSSTLASGNVNGNSVETSISDGVYVPIDVTGFLQDQNTERFRLIDAVACKWEYIGLLNFKSFLTGPITAKKFTSTEGYRFAVSIDNEFLDFTTTKHVPIDVKTSRETVPLELEVSLVTGSVFQVMVAGDGTNDNLTITDLTMGVK